MNKEKKVSFFISSISGGGAESVCINIANALSQKGWKVCIVVLNLYNIEYKDRINKDVKLISLNVSNSKYSFFRIRELIKDEKIKKIIAFDYVMVVLLTMINCTLLNKKFYLIMRNINTISHEMGGNKTFKQYILYKLLSWSLHKVDIIVNQCEAMKEDLLKMYNLDEKKVKYIYNPLSNFIERISRTGDFPEKENYFLCVGRLEKQKGFEYAIQAFSKFLRIKPGYRLKIVGKGTLEGFLKKVAIRYGIENEVDFEGFQHNLIPFYQKSKATLLTSYFEGFPNVLIESISLGTPVISFDCQSGPREIVEMNINGYLVPYLNEAELVNSMVQITQNTMNCKEIASSANKYFIENIISEWEDLLHS